MLSNPCANYREEQIEDWLRAAAVDRGREYIRAVSELMWRRNELSGKVRGSAGQIY